MDENIVSPPNTDFSPFLGAFSHWLLDQCERIAQKKPLFGIPFRKNSGANVSYSLVSSILLSLRDMLDVKEVDGKQYAKALAAPVLVAAVIHGYVHNDVAQWKLQYPQGDEHVYRTAGTFAFLAQGLFLMPADFLYAYIETLIMNAKTSFLLDPDKLEEVLRELNFSTMNEFIDRVYTDASSSYLEVNPPTEE